MIGNRSKLFVTRFLATVVTIVVVFCVSFEFFDTPVFAFLTTLDACAADPECQAAVAAELTPSVAAPGDGTGDAATTISDSNGNSVAAAAPDAVTVNAADQRVAWHYWNQSLNQQAQNQAQQRYRAAHPTDDVFAISFTWQDPHADNIVRTASGDNYTTQYEDQYICTTIRVYAGTQLTALSCVTPSTIQQLGPKAWSDWPQAKRDAATQLLSPSDWQGLISSLPQGGELNPGDSIDAPRIIITGDPNDPNENTNTYTVPDSYTLPDGSPSPNPDPSLPGNLGGLVLSPQQKQVVQSPRSKFRQFAAANGVKDPATGCIYGPVSGHLGTTQDNTAALYATQVSGSPDDYFLISPDGDTSTYDGLTPGTRHLWEAKYGYRRVLDANPDANLIRDTIYQALGSNKAAKKCQYDLTWAFSESDVRDFFGGNWQPNPAYPQDVRFIPYIAP